jgi:hypothetical protein
MTTKIYLKPNLFMMAVENYNDYLAHISEISINRFYSIVYSGKKSNLANEAILMEEVLNDSIPEESKSMKEAIKENFNTKLTGDEYLILVRNRIQSLP